jgi:hypothetical protein
MTSMTALVLEYIKLVMLFLLIGCIIGLSHFSGEKLNGSDSVAGRRMRASARARRILVLSIRLEAAARRIRFVPGYVSSLRQRSLRPLFQ